MWWLAFLTFVAFSQQTASDDPSLVIRSTTSLVQVRVVAQDSKGRPVTDLQREDFQVQDNRKVQPIILFTADRGTVSAQTLAAPVRSTGEAQESAGATGGYSVILLDWVNTEYVDRYRAKDAALRLLKTYQPSQRVAVYLLGKEPRLIKEFTTDMAELAQAIEDVDLEFGEIDNESAPGRFDARYGTRAGSRLSVEEQLFFLNKRITDTLHTFEVIAGRLGHVPGRKSLIWLSDAFPMVVNGGVVRGASPLEAVYYQNLERVLASFNRADVAVYGVDAKGLSTVTRSYAPTMVYLAERTGGTAFYDRNDLETGIQMALEDMQVSYMLGFQVPAGAAAGLHEIRVRVTRPGVKLRYRESYQLAN